MQENIERILELLQKKILSPEEKNELNLLLGNGNDAEKVISTYKKTGDIIKSAHLDADQLGDYILIKNNHEPADPASLKLIAKIEKHLRECGICSNEFKLLNSEYNDIDTFIAERSEKENRSIFTAKKFRSSVYAAASVLLVGVIYLLLFSVSKLVTPDYVEHAAVDDKSQFYITRGRITDNFQLGIKALDEEKYDEAIFYFEKDIKETPNDPTIFYSYYILGLSCLETAEKDFLGLFPSFDKTRAERGLESLKKSEGLNSSGKFNNIKLNTYFYIAKANMMLGNKDEARQYLQLVINEKGSKLNEAKLILSEFN